MNLEMNGLSTFLALAKHEQRYHKGLRCAWLHRAQESQDGGRIQLMYVVIEEQVDGHQVKGHMQHTGWDIVGL